MRLYTADDHQSCINIFESNCPRYFDPSEKKLLENWLNACDEGRVARSTSKEEVYFVAEMKGNVVASGGYYVPLDSTNIYLVWGMVHREHHKTGIGQSLLQYRIKEIIKRYPGYTILLDTSQHTFKFFEKFGFKINKITEHSYGKDLHRYDMSLEV